jgi:hypothetical protein
MCNNMKKVYSKIYGNSSEIKIWNNFITAKTNKFFLEKNGLMENFVMGAENYYFNF